ncbi:MAG: glycosyltransferase family A protein, partial [Actinomycetota bacterium]
MSSPVGTVVASHHATYLRETLGSLLAQTLPSEILVVDDASEGGESRRVARELGIRCIRSTTSLGGAEARNVGIDALHHPWILNFDHDNVAEPKLVERLVAAARRRSRTGITYCTPRQIGMAH